MSWSKVARVLTGIMAIGLVVVLILWFGPILFGGHVTSVSAELNFSALLATLLGGIMAAAGLIVALVSIVSSNTLESRIESKFQKLVEKDEIERRNKTNRMFEGFQLLLRASYTLNLYDAESLTELALELYPDLSGARRTLALRFFNEAEGDCLEKYKVSGLGPRGRVEWPQNVSSASYSYDAEKWLERARSAGEDDDKYLTFCLGKLYGMRGRYDLMIESFRKSMQKITPENAHTFRVITTSAFACDSEPRLKELSELVDMELPMSEENVFNLVEQGKVPADAPIFVCRRKSMALSVYNLPDIYRLRVHISSGSSYRVDFIGKTVQDVNRAPNNDEWLTREDAWTIICNEGWVLCQIDSNYW